MKARAQLEPRNNLWTENLKFSTAICPILAGPADPAAGKEVLGDDVLALIALLENVFLRKIQLPSQRLPLM
jgi:hypothetical protein